MTSVTVDVMVEFEVVLLPIINVPYSSSSSSFLKLIALIFKDRVDCTSIYMYVVSQTLDCDTYKYALGTQRVILLYTIVAVHETK